MIETRGGVSFGSCRANEKVQTYHYPVELSILYDIAVLLPKNKL